MKLINLITARKILLNHAGDKIPAIAAYKIMKFVKASDTEDAFYNEKMKAIIDEYAEKDDKGNPVVKANGIQIQKDHIEDCNKAIKEIQDTEVETPNFKINVGDLASLQLTLEEVATLDEFIEE